MWSYIGISIGALFVLFLLIRWPYYRKMYSKENFRDYYDKLLKALEVAKSKGPGTHPSLDDASAFVTLGNLAVAVSIDSEGESDFPLHISISQPGRPTTHAVSSFFGTFTVLLFKENKADLFPFYTQSTVHHMIFAFQSSELKLREFEDVYAEYLGAKDRERFPFVYQEVPAP